VLTDANANSDKTIYPPLCTIVQAGIKSTKWKRCIALTLLQISQQSDARRSNGTRNLPCTRSILGRISTRK